MRSTARVLCHTCVASPTVTVNIRSLDNPRFSGRSTQDGRTRELRLTNTRQQIAADPAVTWHVKFARVFDAIPETEGAAVLEALQILVEAMRANQ